MTRRNSSSRGLLLRFLGSSSAAGKVVQIWVFQLQFFIIFPNHFSKAFDADSNAEIKLDGSKPVVLGPAASFFGEQQCSW